MVAWQAQLTVWHVFNLTQVDVGYLYKVTQPNLTYLGHTCAQHRAIFEIPEIDLFDFANSMIGV